MYHVTPLEVQVGDVITGPLGEEWGIIRETGRWYVKVERSANNIWLIPIDRLQRDKYGEIHYA